MIGDIFKNISTEVIKQELDKIFTNMTDDDFKKLFSSIFPNVMCSVMHDFISGKIMSYFNDYEHNHREMIDNITAILQERGLV